MEDRTNERQIALAMIMYANADPHGRFPADLRPLITKEALSPDVFICYWTNDIRAPGKSPDEQASHLYDGGHESYVYLGAGLTNAASADTVVLFNPTQYRGNQGGNVLFADGHVEFLPKPALDQIIQMYRANIRPIYWPPRVAGKP